MGFDEGRAEAVVRERYAATLPISAYLLQRKVVEERNEEFREYDQDALLNLFRVSYKNELEQVVM